MNIGMIHQRTGGKCGVALEMDKMSQVLRGMGHEVFYCTGEGPGHLIPELHLLNEEEEDIVQCAFFGKGCDEQELMDKILRRVAFIKPKLEEFIDKYNIELFIVQNIWVVVSHVGTGIALRQIAEERNMPMWAHNHDFYWDFKVPLKPAFPFVEEMLHRDFPPKSKHIQHLVINSIAQRDLKEHCDIDSTLLINVIDSDLVRKYPSEKEAVEFRNAINIGKDDLMVLCGTRIIPHKYIEAAIRLASELNKPENREKLYGISIPGGGTFGENSKIVFVECGKTESFSGWYIEELQKLCREFDVENRWIGERLSGLHPMEGEDLGRLFDAYSHANLLTYTTVHEGWGNQLLEAIAAKKPTVISEYPIFLTDIKQYGLDLISFGSVLPSPSGQQQLLPVDKNRLAEVTKKCIAVISNPERVKQMVEYNHSVLETELSFSKMREILLGVFAKQGLACTR